MTSAASETFITITVPTATFETADVGREFWKKYNADGSGGGRARIIQVLSSTKVVCEVLGTIDEIDADDSDVWFFTSDKITGLHHLENETVDLIVDGGTHQPRTVKNGEITLAQQASKVFVGYKYRGIIESLNLDPGGNFGPAQAKPRAIIKAVLGFFNSVGVMFGSSLYKLEQVIFRNADDYIGRPVPPANGNVEVLISDDYDQMGKKFCIVQDQPLPCYVLSADLYFDVNDE